MGFISWFFRNLALYIAAAVSAAAIFFVVASIVHYASVLWHFGVETRVKYVAQRSRVAVRVRAPQKLMTWKRMDASATHMKEKSNGKR